MAETKKARQIREHKLTLMDVIAELNGQLHYATKTVPQAVRAGSHNVAVEWKELAEKVAAGLGLGSLKLTTKKLEHLVSKRQAMLKKLRLS